MKQSMIVPRLVPSSKSTVNDPHGSSESRTAITRFGGDSFRAAATIAAASVPHVSGPSVPQSSV